MNREVKASPTNTDAVFQPEQIKAELDFSFIQTHLVPPPRFALSSLENYISHPDFPSQLAAKESLHLFIAALNLNGFEKLFRFIRHEKSGLYLDGAFGVGKTHLLAAAYHAAQTPAKAYLSFTELMYLIGFLGLEKCAAALKKYQLICIDEFELDDPGNTMMSLGFLTRMFDAGVRIVATSNTPPAKLGEGRFSASDFQREIGDIANRFTALRIDGRDYRETKAPASAASTWKLQQPAEELTLLYHAYQPDELTGGKKFFATLSELASLLLRFHPMHYFEIAEMLEALFLADVHAFDNQFDALRFVYFIDKLYDDRVKIFASTSVSIEAVFPDEFYKSAYAKKYLRCRSRLGEICRTS
ncbi:MAG: cell division protein ZapE [Rhizobacter sp.]|nr:cell division protein ZapE [Chlorobiales bacterium]